MSESDSTSPSEDALLRAIAQDSELEAREEHPLGSRVGRFVLEQELGRGGMGIVYRAHDDRLGRAVALKVLGKRRERDPERRARFLREARSAASIVHPNVAAVFEIGEADAELYIAMELVAGTSLRQRIAGRPLSIAEGVALARGIARGLAAAHDKQLIHRDLKPENIMVEPSGEPKILDFGLAKLHDAEVTPTVLAQQATRSPSTEDGRILGTPGYMSPEQATGKPLDGRSDLFSFGVVVYEALTAKRPFSYETSAEAIAAVLRDEPTSLRRVRSEVPGSLADVVMQCLAKAPTRRPADAREVLDRLALPTPKRSRTPYAVGLLVFAIVALVIALRPSSPPRATENAAGVPDATTPRGIAMTSYPPPRTNVPAAAAAFAVGLTSIRDGAYALGIQSFVRATKLDSTLAAAQLRVALYAAFTAGIMTIDAHESLALATRFRGSLDERDLALLRIAEAQNADPPDWELVVARAREATVRFPLDVEVGAQLATMLPAIGKLDEGRVQLHHLLELDPGFAFSLLILGQWEYQYRRDAESIALFDRCLALQPSASSCLWWRAEVHEARGECAAEEADARRLVAMDPTSPGSFELLARALAGRGAAIESIRLALDRMVSLGSDLSVMFSAPIEKYWLALLTGDLATTDAALLEVERATTREMSGSFHENLLGARARLAIERGETPVAVAHYYAEVERLAAARSADSPTGVSMLRLYEQHRAKRLGDEQFEKERERLFREVRAFSPFPVNAFDDDRDWIAVFIEGASTKEEMRDALAHLDAHPVHDEWGLTASVLLDAGRYDAAVAVLRPAASRCGVLPETLWATTPTTLWWIETHLHLGEALEGKGDRDGACAAYAAVADRWRSAKPRSIMLDKAKARRRALGCARTPAEDGAAQ